MKIVRPADIGRVLAVTDALGIHREAVRVPLGPVPGGSLRIERQVLVVELADAGEVEGFLERLPESIRELPGVETLKRA